MLDVGCWMLDAGCWITPLSLPSAAPLVRSEVRGLTHSLPASLFSTSNKNVQIEYAVVSLIIGQPHFLLPLSTFADHTLPFHLV